MATKWGLNIDRIGVHMNLYHYYEKEKGPFLNLSDLTMEEANAVMADIKQKKPNVQCSGRDPMYMFRRLMYEDIMRKEFVKKGGIIERQVPHYMVIEQVPWLATWFENDASICIPIEEFNLRTVSFTYGDSHPTFSPYPRDDDWKEYRRKIYTYEEILGLIDKYGLPQDWNGDGQHGPERYIEAHVWSDKPIQKYIDSLMEE